VRGSRSKTASDAEAALTLLGKGPPYDVLMVDKNLPGMSGLELLGQTRKLHPGVEVIVITGYASLDSAVVALRNGAYDYLVKPFSDLREVAEKVRHAAREGTSCARESAPGAGPQEPKSDA